MWTAGFGRSFGPVVRQTAKWMNRTNKMHYLRFSLLRLIASTRFDLLTASRHNTHKIYQCSASWWWANRCSKHVEAINRNKLKANSASCWSYYTDILRCTVIKTLRLPF
jgi:hypothetical protein